MVYTSALLFTPRHRNPYPNSRFHHDEDSFNLHGVRPILIPIVYLVFHYCPMRLDFIDCM